MTVMKVPVPILVLDAVTSLLSHRSPVAVTGYSPARGGCINHGGRLHTTQGSYFLKWNRADTLPGMFEAEAKGLRLLRATRALHVPEVIATQSLGELQYLLLEDIVQESPRRDYWSMLGTHLAMLHRSTSSTFGLDHNNYIGSLPQQNQHTGTWSEFFVSRRLLPLVEEAIAKGLVPLRWREKFDRIFKQLPDWLPEEPPSLLHGDLWQGNVIVNSLGAPCLIDPAVYYGHREVDVAMTKLFGEFDPAFYTAYHESYPLLPGFEKRCELYNLYPLLVHLHLFGVTYVTPIESTLSAFE